MQPITSAKQQEVPWVAARASSESVQWVRDNCEKLTHNTHDRRKNKLQN